MNLDSPPPPLPALNRRGAWLRIGQRRTWVWDERPLAADSERQARIGVWLLVATIVFGIALAWLEQLTISSGQAACPATSASGLSGSELAGATIGAAADQLGAVVRFSAYPAALVLTAVGGWHVARVVSRLYRWRWVVYGVALLLTAVFLFRVGYPHGSGFGPSGWRYSCSMGGGLVVPPPPGPG